MYYTKRLLATTVEAATVRRRCMVNFMGSSDILGEALVVEWLKLALIA